MTEKRPSQMAQERRSASTRIKATLENRPISDAIAVRSWSLATRESTPLRVVNGGLKARHIGDGSRI
jgi:hypothetical protein